MRAPALVVVQVVVFLAGAAAGLSAAPSPRYTVLAGVDGDTVKVAPLSDAQELYWAERGAESIRLLCVAAPERNEAGGKEASAELARRLVPGASIKMEPGKERRDNFGRILAYVQVAGKDVGLALVRGGWARVDRRCDRPDYAQAEREAQAEGLGLWKAEN